MGPMKIERKNTASSLQITAVHISRNNLRYSPPLRTQLDAPSNITVLGNLDILQRKKLARVAWNEPKYAPYGNCSRIHRFQFPTALRDRDRIALFPPVWAIGFRKYLYQQSS